MSEEPVNQTELFTRIDPTKLHGALDNAMKLGTMEVCVYVCCNHLPLPPAYFLVLLFTLLCKRISPSQLIFVNGMVHLPQLGLKVWYSNNSSFTSYTTLTPSSQRLVIEAIFSPM